MSAFNVSFPLQVRESDGQYRDATQEEVIAVARRVLGYRVRRGAALDSPAVVWTSSACNWVSGSARCSRRCSSLRSRDAAGVRVH
jgi:hypothetical protein